VVGAIAVNYKGQKPGESVFDPVLFLERYLEEGEKELWPDIEETDEDTADILFNVEEIEVPIIDDVEIEYL
jgi:hypothetical protein